MVEDPLNIDVYSNYITLLQKIDDILKRVGRDSSELSIVGVTKRIELERITPAIDAGLKIIGEIIGTEFKKKFHQLREYSPQTKFHAVGKLQSNKVKFAVENCDLIQSIQTEKILSLVNKRAQNLNRIYPIFLQTDFSEIAEPKGLNLKSVQKFIATIEDLSHIQIHGIMTIAPLEYEVDKTKLRRFFKRTFKIFREVIAPSLNIERPQLSMGMSNDFEIALEEGSTMIRVGTAIFGPRMK